MALSARWYAASSRLCGRCFASGWWWKWLLASGPHRQIASSIKRFGFTNPVLIDDAGEIIAGHGRVEAVSISYTPLIEIWCRPRQPIQSRFSIHDRFSTEEF
jgi:hypothetical protein